MMTMPALSPDLRPLPGPDPSLAIRVRPRHDRGALILAPDSSDLIAGVEIEAGTLWPDDRGFFTELFRLGQDGFTRGFAATAQVSMAISYAGTIKAVHFHRHQTDLWAPVRGQFQMALFDLRRDSPTFGRVNTVFGGEWRPWRLRIPPGVGHGYKILGSEPGVIVYATDRYYDPSDEGRIAYNDAGLNYDWETQHQ
jgi:dTDP-4-dehydrorhamnose 3,5-epimerase